MRIELTFLSGPQARDTDSLRQALFAPVLAAGANADGYTSKGAMAPVHVVDGAICTVHICAAESYHFILISHTTLDMSRRSTSGRGLIVLSSTRSFVRPIVKL